MVQFFSSGALIIHLVWLLTFFFLEIRVLTALNLGCVALLTVALFIARSREGLALSLASVGMICHSVIAAFFLGWDALYQLHLLPVLYCWCVYAGLSLVQRCVAILVPILSFPFLYVLPTVAQSLKPEPMVSADFIHVAFQLNVGAGLLYVIGIFASIIYVSHRRFHSEQSDGKLDRVLNLGVLHVSETEKRRIRTVNFIGFCAFVLSALYTVAFLLLGWRYAAQFNFLVFMTYTGTIVLNIIGRTRLAAVYILFVGTVHLSVLALVLLEPAAGIQYWLMVVPVFSIAMLHADDKRWTLVLMVLAFGLLGIAEWTAGIVVSPWREETSTIATALVRGCSGVLTGMLIMLVAWLVDLDMRASRVKLDELNTRLRLSLDKEQELNRAKSSFLAQMSHELRTPLNGILGTCEALKEKVYGELLPRQLSALENVDQAARHQLDLVNDLLDLSKIEESGFEPTWDMVAPLEICHDAIEMMQAQATHSKIDIKMISGDDNVQIRSDGRRVRQMVLNLLGNAIKFTPEGGSVTLKLKEVDGDYSISIEDTGIGIPPEELDRMFEPFTQLDSSLSRQHQGTGLGLSLTSKLAVALGGRIQATSEVGKGSCFTIILPMPKSSTQSEQDEEKDDSALVAEDSAGALPRGDVSLQDDAGSLSAAKDGLYVLLADDNPANTDHLCDFLEANGHRVTIGRNGHEAVEKAKCSPDIIFMDIQMPELDGIEAIKAIRANPVTTGLYIVALTSFAMQDDKERCLSAGADEYRSKPIGIHDILTLVEARRSS